MALGKISKLLIFIIVVNSIVVFVANSGVYFTNKNVKTMGSRMDKLHDQATSTINSSEGVTSGTTVLDFFNPLKYKWVADGLGLIGGFFADAPIMFSSLPAPFGNMLSLIWVVLELTALMGIIRGFVV